MAYQSHLAKSSSSFIADTSVLINLNATDSFAKIAQALPNKLLVVEEVFQELKDGSEKGYQDAEYLSKLIDKKYITLVSLGSHGTEVFEELISGNAQDTLDDGEAATIAFAREAGGAVLIDERKANRICSNKFPDQEVGCSVDILSHPKVTSALGKNTTKIAIFNALFHGHMRVLPHHIEWVIKTIGAEKAKLCNSLPMSALKLIMDD